MPNLNEIYADAQGGRATAMLAHKFALAPEQTQAAVDALLPAISIGLKRATATPEGLTNLLSLVAHHTDLKAMYDDPAAAFSLQGRAAGDDVLSAIFGSPEARRVVTAQAQVQSGIAARTLKNILPVLAGLLVSGIFGRKAGETSSPQAQSSGDGLWDVLQQVFQRGSSAGKADTSPASPLPLPGGPSVPPNDGGQISPGGDLLAMMLREMLKAIQDGRLKPVVVQVPFPGDGQIQLPGGQTWQLPSGSPPPNEPATPVPDAAPGATPSDEILPGPKMPAGSGSASGDDLGSVLGNILRDLLSKSRGAPQSGVGAALFGDRFEVGRDLDQSEFEEIQGLLDQALGRQRA